MTNPIVYPPTLEGFIAFTRTTMGIPLTAIFDTDPGYAISYQVALDLVPLDFARSSPDIYTLTVYNFAGSQLLQTQPDAPGQTYFAEVRKAYGINSFVAGVIDTSADSTTSQHMLVGQGLQNLSIMDLQRLKDPYGRQALAYMQAIGTLWGLT
jgi:hypothetical protein